MEKMELSPPRRRRGRPSGDRFRKNVTLWLSADQLGWLTSHPSMAGALAALIDQEISNVSKTLKKHDY